MQHNSAPLLHAPAFKIIGHRGVAGLRPENTLAGFRYAAELGLNCVEFDVQLTSCKQWVVFHDENVERITGEIGKITELSLVDLKKLSAGAKFAAEYRNERIPTLLEALQELSKLNLQANIEVKLCTGLDPRYYAENFASFIAKNATVLTTPPLISSFELTFLQHVRKLVPNINIGYLIEKFTADTINIVITNNFNAIHCNVAHIKPEDLLTAKQHNLPVLLYTINDPSLAKRWLAQGIYALFSDRPDRIITNNEP